MTGKQILDSIAGALDAAAAVLDGFAEGRTRASFKGVGDPVTAADLAVNTALREVLDDGEAGWLSEETADDHHRLDCSRVWVVDPLDGTREFIEGIPEWSVSVGLVEQGRPIAGGVLAPTAGLRILGAEGAGVTINGIPASCGKRDRLEGALVLASRSEVKRGEWNRFFASPISVRNLGSVALKLAMVGAGVADATWTLVPKHEWDVAAGAAIVLSAGGVVSLPDGSAVTFNQPDPKLPGFLATTPGLAPAVQALIARA